MKLNIATFTLASFATLGTLAFAQSSDQSTPQPAPAPVQSAQPHRQATPEQQVKRLTKKLALTGDQQSQILPILADRDQQVSGIQNDSTLTPKQRHAKLLSVRNDTQSRLRTVLTDTQRAAYDQMQQDARAHEKSRKLTTVPDSTAK